MNATKSLIAAGLLTASMVAAVPADARHWAPPLPPRPPLPRVQVWVEPPHGHGYYRPAYVPRHERYRERERVRFWVRGHYDRYGYWVPGHWEVRWDYR